jgi:hypothetical protein
VGLLTGDIQVISVDPVTNRVSIGLVPRVVTGYQKLIQIVVLSLLNSPGKSILNPADGSGLLALLGANVDSGDETLILAEANRAVKKTEEEIINYQSGLGVPDDEALDELEITNLSAGTGIDEVLLTVRVVNQAGRTSNVVV